MAKNTVFNLAQYEKDADKLYQSYKIRLDEETVVSLYNPIRIDEVSRERVFELAKIFDFEEGHEFTNDDLKEMQPAILEMIELVGDENVFMLVERIRKDLVVTMNVFTDYFKAVSLGEASSSES